MYQLLLLLLVLVVMVTVLVLALVLVVVMGHVQTVTGFTLGGISPILPNPTTQIRSPSMGITSFGN